MTFKPLPRYSSGPIALEGALWNRVAEMVERALNLSVADPLQLLDTSNGRLLSAPNLDPNSGAGFVPVLVVRNGGTNGDTASYPAPLFDVWLDLEADTGTDDPDYSGIPLASSPSLIAKATMTGTGNYGQLWTKTTGAVLLFDVQIKYTQWTCTTG